MKYKVSHQGQETGSFTTEEIVAQVRNKELELFDYIFDETKNDWVLLMEHTEVAAKLKSNKPPRPPGAAPRAQADEEVTVVINPPTTSRTGAAITPTTIGQDHIEWFVLKGEHRFGPFGFVEVVRMLQQKVVYPFDFVWHAGLSDWKRLAEIAEFRPEHIRTLFEKGSKKTDVFVQRKHKRKKHNGRVIIHDNLTLWKGESFEISKGGVGVTMKNALVVPGQQVFVHFSGTEGWPSFNAVCEVVSKKFVQDNAPVEYGLRFLSMSQEVQEEFYKKVT